MGEGFRRVRSGVAVVTACAMLGACATDGVARPKADGAPAKAAATTPGKAYSRDPFPSTYRPYAGVPTLITNVTIYDGEGGKIERGQILLADGKIVALGQTVDVPAGALVIDGAKKYVTPGIIDVHSHLGNYPSPGVQANSDGNEATSPVTADVWAEHSVWPQDPGFSRALANGGVTTLQILPGSANLFGGRSVVLKNVYARTAQGMKFPGAPYGLKMACGENPKRVYGAKGRQPSTRMGNVAVNRQTWARAVEYKRKWDKYEKDGGDVPTRDIAMDTLRGVLAGEILVQNHCYRADEMAIVMDMAKEFGYKVRAFHHAVESYKIADLLKANEACSAVWADWWGFKIEAYDGIQENIALVDRPAGGCAIVHSDSDEGIQRLNQEAAKAMLRGNRAGLDIPPERAIRWITYNAAKSLGVHEQTGSIESGKMADVVLWNQDPFSVYAKPMQVYIDGVLRYEHNNPSLSPQSDFELGQLIGAAR